LADFITTTSEFRFSVHTSAAAVHFADMVRNKNFATNNVGPIFWWDILTPLTLLIALLLRAS
jgi:hypothetical protein